MFSMIIMLVSCKSSSNESSVYGKMPVAENNTDSDIINQNETEETSSYSIEIVVEPSLYYDYINPFSDGMAMVAKQDSDYSVTYGFINEKGEEVIPLEFTNAYNFSEGLAAVKYKGGNAAYIDKGGNEVIKSFIGEAYSFREGLALVVDRSNEFVGYIDKLGNRVIDLSKYINDRSILYGGQVYLFAGYFSEGRAYIFNEKTSKYGYIDKTGKVVIDYKYEDAEDFKEGLACVRKDGKYGYIDKDGTLVIPYMYDDKAYFHDGYARTILNNEIIYIDKNGKKSWNQML